MFNNDTFYPTPEQLVYKMIYKIKNNPIRILEPSAGKGDILDTLCKSSLYKYNKENMYCIEQDNNLQGILRDKGYKVIDTDFLLYNGYDKFDLIIGNPPFDTGVKHLLKAIEVMYNGQIIFILNAETLKNSFSNERKILLQKLNEYNADITYLENEFILAERKTKVEIALISFIIENDVEKDILQDITEAEQININVNIKDDTEIDTINHIENIVKDYNKKLDIGVQTIINYYKSYNVIGEYIGLNAKADDYKWCKSKDITDKMQNDVNNLVYVLRKDYWTKTLELEAVKKRLIGKSRDKFYHNLESYKYMDFTEININQFIINLIKTYSKNLTECVLEIFDFMTIQSSYHERLHTQNIHYFNGWKTNNAYKVGRKVILPFYEDSFYSYNNWKIDYTIKDRLDDIDKIMNYFDDRKEYVSIVDAIQQAINIGQTKEIISTYFLITIFKKGTIYLIFNDEKILRRFNICACKGRNWLPEDYAKKDYTEMSNQEKKIVETFENKIDEYIVEKDYISLGIEKKDLFLEYKGV